MVGGSVHGDLLPEDLVFRILLSLPVISLLRFKSVSKSWYVQIESSSFINRHVTTKQNNSGNHYLYQYSNGSCGVSAKPPDIFLLSASDEKFDQVCVKRIDLPWTSLFSTTKNYERHVSLVGSCNGIICVRERVSKTIALWNPATKQLTSFSKFPPIFDYSKNQDFAGNHFGFGFNGSDYKVVQMTFFCSDPYNKRTRLYVYSFSSDTWKSLDTTNLPFRMLAPGVSGEDAVYLNGNLYWPGSYYSDKEAFASDAIVSFDLSNELIKTMSMPDCFYTQNFWSPWLFLLGENIGCNVYDHHSYDSPFEIWVLYEFGVKESWTKLYTIQRFGGPAGFSSNGKFVFLTVEGVDMALDLVLYDPVTQQIIKVLQTKDVFSDIFVYKESLVSVKVGSDAANKEIPAVHTKRRNRLNQSKCNALVYVMFNNRLNKKRLLRKLKVYSRTPDDVALERDGWESDNEWVVEREEEEEEEEKESEASEARAEPQVQPQGPQVPPPPPTRIVDDPEPCPQWHDVIENELDQEAILAQLEEDDTDGGGGRSRKRKKGVSGGTVGGGSGSQPSQPTSSRRDKGKGPAIPIVDVEEEVPLVDVDAEEEEEARRSGSESSFDELMGGPRPRHSHESDEEDDD